MRYQKGLDWLVPDHDHCGYEVALGMLNASKGKGKNVTTHLQFDSIRRFPTVFGNHLRVRPKAVSQALSMVDTKGHYRRMADDPCASMWFTRFKEGCKRRMGSDWNPNQALSIELILALLEYIEEQIVQAEGKIELNRWVVTHTYVVVLRIAPHIRTDNR